MSGFSGIHPTNAWRISLEGLLMKKVAPLGKSGPAPFFAPPSNQESEYKEISS